MLMPLQILISGLGWLLGISNKMEEIVVWVREQNSILSHNKTGFGKRIHMLLFHVTQELLFLFSSI